jgi:hypothetical protein
MSIWSGSRGVYTSEQSAVPTIAAVIASPTANAR